MSRALPKLRLVLIDFPSTMWFVHVSQTPGAEFYNLEKFCWTQKPAAAGRIESFLKAMRIGPGSAC